MPRRKYSNKYIYLIFAYFHTLYHLKVTIYVCICHVLLQFLMRPLRTAPIILCHKQQLSCKSRVGWLCMYVYLHVGKCLFNATALNLRVSLSRTVKNNSSHLLSEIKNDSSIMDSKVYLYQNNVNNCLH